MLKHFTIVTGSAKRGLIAFLIACTWQPWTSLVKMVHSDIYTPNIALTLDKNIGDRLSAWGVMIRNLESWSGYIQFIILYNKVAIYWCLIHCIPMSIGCGRVSALQKCFLLNDSLESIMTPKYLALVTCLSWLLLRV